MINICKDELSYNNLIKKCSVYEFCKGISTEIINKLKNQKTFKLNTLHQLLNEIEKYEKIKYGKLSKHNIFFEKMKEIKNYEIEFNKIKLNIKKILINEKNNDEYLDKDIIPVKFHEILK